MDFNSLMKQAQKMQEEMERKESELKEKTYTNNVSKSIVSLEMNSDYQITDLKINEDFIADFEKEDKEILEDAILLAVNEVTSQVTADKEGMLGELAGGLNIPGMR